MGIVLIGMMGAGKTTVGRRVAERLGWRFVDVDEEIMRVAGMGVGQIFEELGEEWFRARESEILFQCVGGGYVVVSAGGGAPLLEKNWEAFRGIGVVIYLRADLPTLLSRVGSGEDRPLLRGDVRKRLWKLLEERKSVYERADWILDVDALDVDAVVHRVFAIALGAHRDEKD
ncbi:MAG: shikimate kinase [Candidatus Caldarchaeum sp.]